MQYNQIMRLANDYVTNYEKLNKPNKNTEN